MNTMTDSELSVLNAATMQFSHSITAAQRTADAHLTGEKIGAETVPDGTPSYTELDDILKNAAICPGTTSIVSVPEESNTMLFLLTGIQLLDTYVAILVAYCIHNEHPGPYNLQDPKDANAFARVQAKWCNHVLNGGVVPAIAGYLRVGSITSESYCKSVTKGDLNHEFLAELFGDFTFPEAVLAELDRILTEVVAKVGAVKCSCDTQGVSVDHFLTYYYFDTVQGTGGKNQPPAMYVGNIRTFCLHIDLPSWADFVDKSSGEHFHVRMNYSVMDATMNTDAVARDRNAIQKRIEVLIGKTEGDISKIMNMHVIQVDQEQG